PPAGGRGPGTGGAPLGRAGRSGPRARRRHRSLGGGTWQLDYLIGPYLIPILHLSDPAARLGPRRKCIRAITTKRNTADNRASGPLTSPQGGLRLDFAHG